MFDIWPDHKEVTVPDSGEELLRAINDRGITRPVVEDGVAAPAELSRHTRESAESRLVSALAYAPHGNVPGGDVAIRGNAVTESYVDDVLDASTMVPAEIRESVRLSRSGGSAIETYRRVPLEHAFELLATSV